jgi:hypothetical protein
MVKCMNSVCFWFSEEFWGIEYLVEKGLATPNPYGRGMALPCPMTHNFLYPTKAQRAVFFKTHRLKIDG